MSRQIISIPHKKNNSSSTFYSLSCSHLILALLLHLTDYTFKHIANLYNPLSHIPTSKEPSSQKMMPYKSTLITAIPLAIVCLIQGAFAAGYEGLCVAGLESNDFKESTEKCCKQVRADLNDTIPLYVTCANMSEGQLDDFTKCCPIIVHVDSKNHHGKGKSKNDKRDTSKRIRRNSKRRNDSE